MLHSHRRIAIPGETRFVLNGYDRRRQFGDLADEVNRRALAEWITKRKASKFHDLGLDADEVTERIVAAPPTLGSAMATVFQAYAERFGKPRWGDKRPSYLPQLRAVMRLFPDAQFVNVVRDGRDCVASLKEAPWYKHSVYHAIATWSNAVDAGSRAGRALGPARYHEVRYEDLVADPERTLHRLCDFLGEPFDPAMTEPYRIAPETIPEKKTWHDRTREPVTTGRVRSWENRLTPEEIALTEAVLGSRLRAGGYELGGAVKPAKAELLKYYRVYAERRQTARRRVLVDQMHSLREPELHARQG